MFLEIDSCNEPGAHDMFINYLLIKDYFFKYAFVFIIRSVRLMHDQVPFTPGLYIHKVDRICKFIRSPPVGDVLLLCSTVCKSDLINPLDITNINIVSSALGVDLVIKFNFYGEFCGIIDMKRSWQ